MVFNLSEFGGMGSIGRTTIARIVLKTFSSQFEGVCFLADIRESQGKMSELQKTLIKTISNGPVDNISNVHDGMDMIMTRFKEKKVLIVLDDVDHVGQLRKLAGDYVWFGGGSRVIITTRDAGVLRSHGVDEKYIYKVETLREKEAIQLFRSHAFKQKAKTGVEELCGPVVHYCKGLPLALKVLGSSLCGLEAIEWESTLEKLKDTPDEF
ncbi:TMV resistance protein N-like [Ipomoea triloba]|uniref:TMV resistance protein N-like n=1 Tax=Ipomoea triloba TaxID=35885 RepID=UPI00125D2B9B|nr:TMV resistance protein N-like [Ipomoea triloba]